MPKHPITKYCEAEDLFYSDIAVAAGISKGYLSHIINGSHQCGAVAAMKIHRVTGGRVTIHDLITWKERVEKAAQRKLRHEARRSAA